MRRPRSTGARWVADLAACETTDVATHVTLTGDYVVVDKREDGSLVIEPDTSMEAIRRRHSATPATLEEFEAEYGPVGPPDGES